MSGRLESRRASGARRPFNDNSPSHRRHLHFAVWGFRLHGIVYFEKIRVFKAGNLPFSPGSLRGSWGLFKPLNTTAWDNGIGLASYFVGF